MLTAYMAAGWCFETAWVRKRHCVKARILNSLPEITSKYTSCNVSKCLLMHDSTQWRSGERSLLELRWAISTCQRGLQDYLRAVSSQTP